MVWEHSLDRILSIRRALFSFVRCVLYVCSPSCLHDKSIGKDVIIKSPQSALRKKKAPHKSDEQFEVLLIDAAERIEISKDLQAFF